eukprot:scaffold4673_cov63-Phaeocystis_antarctica.AAC.2
MAFASRGTLTPPPDHSSSDSPGGAPPAVSIHGQPTGANPLLDAQPSGSAGSSARAARAKPHEPAISTPTADCALLTASDTDSSHTVGGAACKPVIEDTSCRARASAESGKSDSVAATTMTGRSFASSACGALSRRNTAESFKLPSSRIDPAPAELPPGASCHAVWYMCRRAVVAAELSTRVRNPSICALPIPSSLPSDTSAASAPDAGATAHSTPAAGPRISTPSIANGKRSSDPPIGPPLRSRAVNCSAPSRSAGCTCVPASEARRRKRAVASLPSSHAASKRRGVGHVAAPLPRRRQPERPPRRRVRRRPLPAAVHRRHCLATAAAHLERAALKQRALHPRRAPLLQHQRLQEEHATQRRARCRGRSHDGACRARRLDVSRTRDDDAPTHDMVGHQRVQRAGHGRTEEGRAARGSQQSMLQQRVGRLGPQEGATAEAERRAAAHSSCRLRHDCRTPNGPLQGGPPRFGLALTRVNRLEQRVHVELLDFATLYLPTGSLSDRLRCK